MSFAERFPLCDFPAAESSQRERPVSISISQEEFEYAGSSSISSSSSKPSRSQYDSLSLGVGRDSEGVVSFESKKDVFRGFLPYCASGIVFFTMALLSLSGGGEQPVLGVKVKHRRQCHPGQMGNMENLLPFQTWTADNGINLPYYSTGTLDEDRQKHVTRAVIIQHGFLRNANQYFCAAFDALRDLDELREDGAANFLNTLVIAPQLLLDGDICWDENGNALYSDLSSNPMVDCNLPIWSTNQSWLDGELNYNPVDAFGFPGYLYSYDHFTLFIDRLSDTSYFPNLENITVFGFSAGAQILQRYSLAPKYQTREGLDVRIIISDPSGFAYFTDIRPAPDGSGEFGVPVPDNDGAPGAVGSRWIPEQWAYTMTENNWKGGVWELGKGAIPEGPLSTREKEIGGDEGHGVGFLSGQVEPWIPSWDEGECYAYNLWRTGLHQLTGYLKSASEEGLLQAGLENYITLDITYMIGWQDTCNCNLGNTSYNTHVCYFAPFNGNNGSCDDNILENTCPAMLQGINRYERMINWMKYLDIYYGPETMKRFPHRLVKANVGHDYVGMINSAQGACTIFGHGCLDPGVLNSSTVTPGIYGKNEYLQYVPGPKYPARDN